MKSVGCEGVSHLDLVHAGVHGAADVRGSRPGPPTLVMYRPGRVLGPHIPSHGQVGWAIPRLIAQGPDADAGEILVPVHHAHDSVHHGRQPQRVVGGHGRIILQPWVEAVRLQIGLVQEVDAVLGAQLIPATAEAWHWNSNIMNAKVALAQEVGSHRALSFDLQNCRWSLA